MSSFWQYPLVKLGGVSLTTGQVISTILILVLGWIILAMLSRRITARLVGTSGINTDRAQTIQRVIFYLSYLLVLLTGMSLLNIPVTAFAFMSGAIAIGVGFGAQNIINNFISGWILMSERPIRIGDFVEVDGAKGVIEKIGNRSTRIKRIDGVHLLVPNSILLEKTVINWTLIDKKVNTSVKVGVAYGSDVEHVRTLLLDVATANPEVLSTPPPTIYFDNFGNSALEFEMFFWCEAANLRELKLVATAIRFAVDAAFRQHDIVIAFPQTDIHLKSPSSALPCNN